MCDFHREVKQDKRRVVDGIHLEALVEELLAARADIEQPSERGQSPLMLASAAGHMELCQKLLKEAWMARCWPKYRYSFGTPKNCAGDSWK